MTRLTRFCLALPGLFFGCAGQAQQSPAPAATQSVEKTPQTPASQLSPGAAYQDAVKPVEITHRSIANWSPVEQASLGTAVQRAGQACAARPAQQYAGEELVDLGRLCSLGLAWPAAITATSRYLAGEHPGTRLAEAYAIQIDAELHLKDEPAALRDTTAMLHRLPYTLITAQASTEALDYMELLYTPDAVSLAALRQPAILILLRQSLSPTEQEAPQTSSSTPSPADLYRQALRLAQLQQFNGDAAEAETTVASLEQAVATGLSSDDRLLIEGFRRQYQYLGQPLPVVAPSSSLDVAGHLPRIPALRAITALLLFPDWCAQCIRMAQHMPQSVFSVEKQEAYMDALLVQTVPPRSPPLSDPRGQSASDAFSPACAASYLRGTPTVIVGADLLTTFNAVDVPLLIVTDAAGIVRLIEVIDEDALQPGQTVDSAIAAVGRRWPLIRNPKPTAPGASHSAGSSEPRSPSAPDKPDTP